MRRPLLWAMVAILAAGVARAELKQFCAVEKVDVQKVSNAIVIKLQCDGLIDLRPDIWTMKWNNNEDDFSLKETDRISFVLQNAVSGSASMVNVAQYPVSHLAFEMEPGSEQNLGIRCTLHLYKPGLVFSFTKRKRDFSRWWDNPDRGDEWDYLPFREWFDGEFFNRPWVSVQMSEDQKQVIISVQSDRPEEPEPVRPAVEEAKPFLEVSGGRDRLHVRSLHTSLIEVVERLSDQTGVPVFVEDQVACRITAHLSDMSLARVLAALSTSYGLNMAEADGTYYLTRSRPDNPASYWASTTRTVPLRHLTPGEAVLMLPDVALPYVHANSDGNALVVDGPVAMVARVERDLAAMDQPVRHCRLRYWVVSTQDARDDVRSVLAKIAGGTTRATADSDGNLSLTVGPDFATDTLADLRLLARRGHLRLQALPAIICQAGESARLFVGHRVYYLRTAGEYGEITLDQVDVGTEMAVRARNVGETITAWVSVSNSFTGAKTDQGPAVFTRSAQGILRVPSGGLMIIGGLRMDEAGKDRELPLAALQPLTNLISGRFKSSIRGEVTLLVQAESMDTLTAAQPQEVMP